MTADPVQKTFAGHLEELRSRLILCLLALTVAAAGAFVYGDELLKLALLPISSQMEKVYFFSPAEAFLIKIKLSLLAGVFISLPLLAMELWLFVSPALREPEKKAVVPLVLMTSTLFMSGAYFCFKVALPMALNFFVGQSTDFLRPMISVSNYIDFLSGMVLAFGFAFNLPVFTLAFVFVGVLTSKTLGYYRKHAVLLIFIAAAILTPSPDVASQLLLAVPLIVLFEISVIGARIIEAMRGKA